MKIAHIMWSAHFGGIQNLVMDLVQEQKIRGFDPLIITAKDVGILMERLRKEKFKFEAIGINSGYDISPLKYLRLFRIIRQYDIIHLHDFNLFIAITVLFSRKKIVYTEHGNFEFNRIPKINDKINIFFRKIFIIRFVNHLIFNSYYTKKICEEIYHVNLKNSSVIYNGIKFPVIINKSLEDLSHKLKNKFVVGYSGRFAMVKKVERLIESFSRLNNQDTFLLLIGDGPLLNDYKELCKTKGIEGRVIFAGYVTDVTSYQNLMDVCVMPSSGEAFGLTAIETLSLGKPTVSFKDGGGLVEIIEPICPEDIVENIDQLAERIKFYIDHPEELEKNKITRMERAKEFSIKKHEVEIRKVYCSVLKLHDEN